MAEGIVLAAGLSSRMGKYKLTLDLGGKTVIERCIESMYDYCSNIIVVCGHNHHIIEKTLRPYYKIKIVVNENYMDGMFSSVKEGLKYVREERCFLTPGDCPLIKGETYKKLLAFHDDIVIPTYEGIKGHPVLMKSCVIEKKFTNHQYISLRDVIMDCDFATAEVEDPGILMDIDTMNDYEKLYMYIKEDKPY